MSRNRYSVRSAGLSLCIVLLYLVSASTSQSSSPHAGCKHVALQYRVSCGCAATSQDECHSRGCCYDSSSTNAKCFFPDVDKCLVNNGGCSPDAKCTSNYGNVTCVCKTGFKGNGLKCKDVDECEKNNGGCPAHATCINTPGSSLCACKIGYTETGFGCAVANNIALHKTATQSSTVSAASRAVDGNLNPSYSAGSCSMTSAEYNPWWAVDLGTQFHIDGVLLTNRGDCCGENMNNFIVGLTNNQPTPQQSPTLFGYTLCGQWAGVAHSGRSLGVKCTPGLHPARYVVIMTQKPTLTICELQVFGKAAHNVALRRSTMQSSTQEGYFSSKAVDGNESPLISLTGSCSMTIAGDLNPWWAVDLGSPHKIHGVLLTNRNDFQNFRMDFFKVGLSNVPPHHQRPTNSNYTLCGRYKEIAGNGLNLPVTCTPGLPAFRYVIIMTHRTGLTICELKVFRTIDAVDTRKLTSQQTDQQ